MIYFKIIINIELCICAIISVMAVLIVSVFIFIMGSIDQGEIKNLLKRVNF